MQKSQNALREKEWNHEQEHERPLLVLERHLIDTLALQWHIQKVQIRSRTETSASERALFDGMSTELRTFVGSIRQRLECLGARQVDTSETDPDAPWPLFGVDTLDARGRFEALLCGYAYYARQTSDAISFLRKVGDRESSELLGNILNAVYRCLGLFEIRLEELALNMESSSCLDWFEGEPT
jgi:hypothetical protein